MIRYCNISSAPLTKSQAHHQVFVLGIFFFFWGGGAVQCYTCVEFRFEILSFLSAGEQEEEIWPNRGGG